jgi:hypothetical protein
MFIIIRIFNIYGDLVNTKQVLLTLLIITCTIPIITNAKHSKNSDSDNSSGDNSDNNKQTTTTEQTPTERQTPEIATPT